MTLILALKCAGGLVLASDSQGTAEASGQHVKIDVKKIEAPWSNVAWGASGAVGIQQRVQEHLHGRYPHPSALTNKKTAFDLRETLHEEISKVVRPLMGRFIGRPDSPLPVFQAIVIASTPERPMILEIDKNLCDEDHTELGYWATGNGEIFPHFAMTGLKHFDVPRRGLFEAKLIAYRTVEDAIKISAFGLGPPVQMIEIPFDGNQAGKTHLLTKEDLDLLDYKVGQWRQAESEALSQFVGITLSDDPGDGDADSHAGRLDDPPTRGNE